MHDAEGSSGAYSQEPQNADSLPCVVQFDLLVEHVLHFARVQLRIVIVLRIRQPRHVCLSSCVLHVGIMQKPRSA